MKTQIFNSYSDFLNRSEWALNGVTPEFAKANPDYKKANNDNKACWNCSDCSGCSDCSRCRKIPEGAKAACFTGIYTYVCSPRIHADNTQWVQMGCHLRTRENWEKDFWNNPKEFPNDNSEKSNNRMLAFKMACIWLDS